MISIRSSEKLKGSKKEHLSQQSGGSEHTGMYVGHNRAGAKDLMGRLRIQLGYRFLHGTWLCMCLVTGSLLLILFDRKRWGKGKKME